jgi:AcrR family transcriptional regulator
MAVEIKREPAGAAVLRDGITQAIRGAVLEELASVGYGRMSIEAVARRAGVGKTAVYRRWPSKLEMVIETVTPVAMNISDIPDTGSLLGDLSAVLMLAGRFLRHPLAGQIVPDLLAEAARNPAIAQTLQTFLRDNQRAIFALLVIRAVERGELAAEADPDLVADMVIGPLYWRLAVTRAKLPADYLPRLAAGVVAGLTAMYPAG